MNRERTFWLTAGLLTFGLIVLGLCRSPKSAAVAAPPWAKLLNANAVEADPKKEYVLKEDNGPWMIMACSFVGPDAEKRAKELVLELRKKYRLEAYVHQAQFKLDDPNAPGAGHSPIRWQYRRVRDNPQLRERGELEEVAVLVGNYQGVDDSDGQKTLQKLKYATPDCLKIEQGKSPARPFAVLRALQKAVVSDDGFVSNQHQDRGPMSHAFITTNPLLPAGYYAPKGVVDELVLKMNKGVPHSLLDCPGKYTVQVAHFTGEVIIDQKKIREVEKGKPVKSKLMEAAAMANTLTEALRMKGYEAYEFHDRYSSIVCVGSFDSVGSQDADGKIQMDPKILAIMKTFGAEAATGPGAAPGAVTVKSLLEVPLDFQPIPVEVPKRSISRELARRVSDRE